jgi:hypothetical protein
VYVILPEYGAYFKKSELSAMGLLSFLEKTLGGLQRELGLINPTMVDEKDSLFDWNENAWVG